MREQNVQFSDNEKFDKDKIVNLHDELNVNTIINIYRNWTS